jgi:hypothetical protein
MDPNSSAEVNSSVARSREKPLDEPLTGLPAGEDSQEISSAGHAATGALRNFRQSFTSLLSAEEK